jgi:hypothetical protein
VKQLEESIRQFRLNRVGWQRTDKATKLATPQLPGEFRARCVLVAVHSNFLPWHGNSDNLEWFRNAAMTSAHGEHCVKFESNASGRGSILGPRQFQSAAAP